MPLLAVGKAGGAGAMSSHHGGVPSGGLDLCLGFA